VKLVHDILPTNDNLSKRERNRTPECPSCNHPSEDRDHIIRCNSREAMHISSLVSIRKRCEKLDTRPYLMEILLDGLENWYNDQPMETQPYPARYHRLIHQQNKIGWRQLFNGRMSVEWATLQQDHLATTGLLGKTRSGHLWTTAIITVIWAEWRKMWKMRNGIIHGHDTESRAKIQRLEAERNLHSVYTNRNNMLPSTREVLFDTMAEHLTHSTRSITNWYTTYAPTIKASIRTAKQRALRGVRSIRSYFAIPTDGPAGR
jgi:hypothetical protein